MPGGDQYVWVEETSTLTGPWRVLAPGTVKGCRYRACRKPAVAELYRRGRRPGWWAYCAGHLYGRRVEGGRVMCRVHPDGDMAERARRETVPPLTEDFHS